MSVNYPLQRKGGRWYIYYVAFKTILITKEMSINLRPYMQFLQCTLILRTMPTKYIDST